MLDRLYMAPIANRLDNLTRSNLRAVALVVTLLLAYACMTGRANAQGFVRTTVFTFAPGWLGEIPATINPSADGNLYGQAEQGGSFGFGTVYQLSPTTGLSTVLHSFNGTDGTAPASQSPVVLGPDGYYYGTAPFGGAGFASPNAASGNGVVFKVATDGKFAALHKFIGTDGSRPMGGVVLVNGYFYGVTSVGGAHGYGTFYRITTAGVLTTLYNFTATDGNPNQLSKAANGTIYGTTWSGGASHDGTVFTITTSGALTTIYQVVDSDGGRPLSAPTVGLDGNLYVPVSLSANDPRGDGPGAILQVTPLGAHQVVHTFSGPDGWNPGGSVLALGVDGSLYGATTYGGNGYTTASTGNGTIFKIAPNLAFSSLYAFNPADGTGPLNGVSIGNTGILYGTTSGGGALNWGTAFQFSGGVFTKMVDFGAPVGTNPQAGLIHGADGAFYGTMYADIGIGNYPWVGNGSVFRVTPDGAFTQLHHFLGLDGERPYDCLVQGADGSLYGTTEWGGPGYTGAAFSGNGGVFKVGLDGSYSLLHAFNGIDGSRPSGSLIFGQDGFLYGTALAGGLNNTGTIFKLKSDGSQFTVLYNFSAIDSNGLNADGANPTAALLQAPNGVFYSTCDEGGAHGYGTVFAFNGTTVTTLHAFVGGDGAYSQTPLIFGKDGNLWGTTTWGGVGFAGYWSSGNGTVFHLATIGSSFHVDHWFNGNDGQATWSGLLQATDGNFYGGNTAGGNGYNGNTYSGSGTLFMMTPADYLTRISTSGMVGTLIQLTDGSMWGLGGGGVFRLSATTKPAVPTGLTASPGNGRITLSWTPSAGATSYNIYRGTTSYGQSATPIAAGVTGPSYVNTGLTNGVTYYYRIAAFSTLGNSAEGNQAAATPLPPPAVPTNLTASPGNAKAILSWTAGATATSYSIFRGTTSFGQSATPVATGVVGTTYTDTGLTNGVTYFYRVAAFNGGGNSAESNQASTKPIAPPAIPTGLTATAGTGSVTLNWTASAGATSYNVYRGTVSGGESATPIAMGVAGTTYTDTGLTHGTTYYYRVAAFNAGGNSAEGNQASATP